MDHSPDERERDSLTRTSTKQISASRLSCEDGAEHVRSSRAAVGRSLRLLNETAQHRE